MEVSIIVNHYRTPKALKLSLEYIRQWQREYEVRNGERTTEIIVTDSATIPATKQMMSSQFSSVVFLAEEKNIGFGRSMNRALRIASGRVVFMMNADLIVPKPQELDNLIRYIQTNQQVGVVAPRLCNFDNTLQYSAFQFYTPLVVFLRRTALGKTQFGKKRLREFLLVDKMQDIQVPIPVDWVMGSAMLTTRQHLLKVGLFDERFFMYMEDVDLCRRFWRQGLEVVYYPLSTMYHFHNKASGGKNMLSILWNKYTYIHFSSAVKYFMKYRGASSEPEKQQDTITQSQPVAGQSDREEFSKQDADIPQNEEQPTQQAKPSESNKTTSRSSIVFF